MSKKFLYALSKLNKEFLITVKSKSMYDTNQDITENDTILTLSTCDYTRKNGRFVVQCKLINE